jgi:hypothetical protein
VGRAHLENSLVFLPMKYPDGYWDAGGLPVEDAWFTAADGVALHGWYLAHPEPRAAVLLAHGNAGNLSHRWPLLALLHELGCSVLIFDYRGYGRSAGSPNEQGVYRDARAARDWLAEREGLAPDGVVLHGRSLGSAVVADVAAADGARGLILENAFDNARNVGLAHFPRWLVALLQRSPFDSAGKLPSYRGPLLVIHGEQDEVVPFALGRALFEAGNEPKTFVALPGLTHNDHTTLAARGPLDAFLESLPPAARRLP